MDKYHIKVIREDATRDVSMYIDKENALTSSYNNRFVGSYFDCVELVRSPCRKQRESGKRNTKL